MQGPLHGRDGGGMMGTGMGREGVPFKSGTSIILRLQHRHCTAHAEQLIFSILVAYCCIRIPLGRGEGKGREGRGRKGQGCPATRKPGSASATENRLQFMPTV